MLIGIQFHGDDKALFILNHHHRYLLIVVMQQARAYNMHNLIDGFAWLVGQARRRKGGVVKLLLLDGLRVESGILYDHVPVVLNVLICEHYYVGAVFSHTLKIVG